MSSSTFQVSNSQQCIAMSSRSNPVFDLIFQPKAIQDDGIGKNVLSSSFLHLFSSQRAILFITRKIHSAVNGGSHQYLHQPVQSYNWEKRLAKPIWRHSFLLSELMQPLVQLQADKGIKGSVVHLLHAERSAPPRFGIIWKGWMGKILTAMEVSWINHMYGRGIRK